MTLNEGMGRLFLAVALSEELREDLAAYINRALQGKALPGRAPKPDNWHLTLRFLGEIDQIQYEHLLATLQGEALGEAFEIGFGGLGAFPRLSKASVLWVGIEQGREPLCRLATSVERAVEKAGLPPADKPFSPHLTLSRIRPPQPLDSLVRAAGAADKRMAVRQVILYRSHLGANGARYEPLERFALT